MQPHCYAMLRCALLTALCPLGLAPCRRRCCYCCVWHVANLSPTATAAAPAALPCPCSLPQDGPGISWAQLRNFQHCEPGGAIDCAIFKDRHPSTIRCVCACMCGRECRGRVGDSEGCGVACRGGICLQRMHTNASPDPPVPSYSTPQRCV